MHMYAVGKCCHERIHKLQTIWAVCNTKDLDLSCSRNDHQLFDAINKDTRLWCNESDAYNIICLLVVRNVSTIKKRVDEPLIQAVAFKCILPDSVV